MGTSAGSSITFSLLLVGCFLSATATTEQDCSTGSSIKVNSSTTYPMTWSTFNRLNVIYDWIDAQAKAYPQWVKVLNIGKSYEGRKLKGVSIIFNKTNPGIVLEGGIYGDDWLSPATSTYLIKEILSGRNETFNKAARAHSWYIFPMLNPDGYQYSRTTDRMWRKTRRPRGNNCTGVDIDRNWDFHWMANEGASQDPCSEAYAGPKPFSEVETKAFADYIASISDKFYVFLSFRGHGFRILVPYGWTYDRPTNYNESMAVGAIAVEALRRRYGATYLLGTASGLEFVSSGGSADYVKGVYGTRFVYTYKLRDDSDYAWTLPDDAIDYNNEETRDSIAALISETHKLAYEDTV